MDSRVEIVVQRTVDLGDLGEATCTVTALVQPGEPTVIAADPNDSYEGSGPDVEELEIYVDSAPLDVLEGLNIVDSLHNEVIADIERDILDAFEDLDFNDY